MSSPRTLDSYMLEIRRSIVAALALVPLLTAGAWLAKLVRHTGAVSDSCPVLRVDFDPAAAGVVIRACGEIEVAGRSFGVRYDVMIELSAGSSTWRQRN